MGATTSIMNRSRFPEVSPYHKNIIKPHQHKIKISSSDSNLESDLKQSTNHTSIQSLSLESSKSFSGGSDEKSSDEVEMQPTKLLKKGDFCTLPQIFHRRDLIHQNKLTTFERKIIMKKNIDTTVAEVIETEGTYLKLRMLNSIGEWDILDKVWILHVEQITEEIFREESKRLEKILQSLTRKVFNLRQKVREWHQECGHVHDDKINRVQDGVNIYYECTICGKILGIEKLPSSDSSRRVFEILDSRWFLQSFPEHLRISLICKEGDSQIIRKRELLFAERQNWIKKTDRELALFNSREFLTDALVILANMNVKR